MGNENGSNGCPFTGAAKKLDVGTNGTKNKDWWPNQLDLNVLRSHSSLSDPMGEAFDYAEEFKKLDYEALKRDLNALMTDSQDWWPADFGHYGPQMIRMTWHAAGTYRVTDGRGGGGRGQQRFAPLNSWPDNVNIDKSRRLLWPIKQKYGKQISWADLLILAGNVALESMGFRTFGFGAGRADVWEPDQDMYWGDETEWLGDDKRFSGDRELNQPLAATHMGLIYVNPQGPQASGDYMAGRQGHPRRHLTAWRWTMKKSLPLSRAATHSERHTEPHPNPTKAPNQKVRRSKSKASVGRATTAAATEPTRCRAAWRSHGRRHRHSGVTTYFENLFKFEWEQTRSPAGAIQWIAKDAEEIIPDAHIAGKFHKPTMLTTDLTMRIDPEFEKISRRFLENPQAFAEAFARAWFKLTHRDMGPKVRYLGPEVPAEELIWQDPIPASTTKLDANGIAALKAKIADSGLSVSELVSTAWASASTFRGSDKRGGANGARVRLAPQKDWAVNNPTQLAKVLGVLEGIKAEAGNVSLADLIVLAGNVGVETAAKAAGFDVTVPFTPGRGDATQEQTDVESFDFMQPAADGFRNYLRSKFTVSTESLLVDKANLLTLTAPEMTVLVGGMRVMGTNFDGSQNGVFTGTPGTLTNDFFTNLLDMSTAWKATDDSQELFEGTDRKTGAKKWSATRADLIFGSNSELRALAEVYASGDAKEKFVKDFVAAWDKVMNLDRF